VPGASASERREVGDAGEDRCYGRLVSLNSTSAIEDRRPWNRPVLRRLSSGAHAEGGAASFYFEFTDKTGNKVYYPSAS